MRRLLLAVMACPSGCDHTSIQGATNSAGSGYTALVGNGTLNLNRTTYDSAKVDIP
jgi:hypothetical protein